MAVRSKVRYFSQSKQHFRTYKRKGERRAGSHSLSAGRESVQSSEGSSQLTPQNKHGLNKQAPFIRDVCFLGMLNENCC